MEIFINQNIKEMGLAKMVSKDKETQEESLVMHNTPIKHIETIVKFLSQKPSIKILDLTNCSL